MKQWLKKRWKAMAASVGSLLIGLGTGEALDLPAFIAQMFTIIL